MPGARLRELVIRVLADDGAFGAQFSFPDGLTVLRAANSSGKSLALQAVLFAFGLEGMVSRTHAVPFPHAMTDRLTDPSTGEEHRVLESWVLLEVENAREERITIQRWARHSSRDLHLVRVWNGPVVSEPGDYDSTDLFVRRSGAATRETGFHTYLAKFFGWDLPLVPTFDDLDRPLYMEVLFPLFYVEQKHGWSGILNQIPTHFRIKDVRKRALEFVLALDTAKNAIRRQELEEEKAAVVREWDRELLRLREKAGSIGAAVSGLPQRPQGEWPPAVSPRLLMASGEEWVPAVDVRESQKARLEELQEATVPTVSESAPELSSRLRQLTEELNLVEAAASGLVREVYASKEELTGISTRLVAVEEDLQRNQDVHYLQKVGGVLSSALAPEQCPTCHQNLEGIVLAPGIVVQPLAVEENIAFLKEQRFMFEEMRDATTEIIAAKENQLQAIRLHSDGLRTSIRTTRETLVTRDSAPSKALIEEQVLLGESIKRIDEVVEELGIALDQFTDLSAAWIKIIGELDSIKGQDLTNEDNRKIGVMQDSFSAQLADYDFRSLDIPEVKLSTDTYLPTHEGFDLGFDLSGSDMIRTIWAYYMSMLELDRQAITNHLGMLILDEPGQQSTETMSYVALLRRASEAFVWEQQVIFATSEPSATVINALAGRQANIIEVVDNKILTRVSLP